MKSRSASSQRTFISLFCGCGGFDLGFLEEGYRCVGAFDIDRAAVEHHRANLNSNAQVCDLSRSWPLSTGVFTPDVMLAGTPCQGFSTAGKRQLNDPRNELLLIAGRIAAKVQPRIFIAENVAGVTAGEHKRYWQSLRHILWRSNYNVVSIERMGTEMGVAQFRKRVLMIAWKTSAHVNFTLSAIPGGVLRSALKNIRGALNHDPQILPVDSRAASIATHIKPGQKLSNVRAGPRSVHTWDIPAIFGRTTFSERLVLETLLRLRRQRRIRSFGDADPVSAHVIAHKLGRPVTNILGDLRTKGYVRRVDDGYDLTHSFNGKFRRLEWDQPSYTVDTRFGNPRYFLHPDENRGFTVREAARLQGFPDSFLFAGSPAIQYRLVGNAVPPPVSRLLAKHVAALL